MMVHDRLERIKALLAQHPRCSVTRIQKHLGVSRATARRDLLELEAQGALVRVHGGVINREYLHAEPTFDLRSRAATDAKRRIGQRAAALVGEGEAVFVDAGTTCLEAGLLLLLRRDVRIFTNSVRLLAEARHGEAEVTCVGGSVRRPTEAMVGALALAWLKELRFDIAILGASGISKEEGASTTELSEAAIKQAAIERSRQRVLVADASKQERPAAVTFAGWSQFDYWVTDTARGSVVRRLQRCR
ncbi:MAG: DeoR/GlpR family DNA-binding transcription regulator [Phycisphaeraceae bacterium]